LEPFVITVDNVSKSCPGHDARVLALRDVSLAIEAGSIYGILGPAAAGKSTLARCIGLRERPDRGVVRFDGHPASALEGRKLWDAWRQVALVDTRLRPERTAAGNVAEPLERTGVEPSQRRSRVGALLELAGLSRAGSRLLDELSPGQRHRIAVAKALATQPSVLLADDPTAALTAEDAAAVLAVLDRARGELGATVVLTTRDAAAARRVCDGVALLDSGRVIEHGALLSLLADPGSRVADALLPAIETSPAHAARYERSVDVVLIGFAAVGALLPEAAHRFDVDISTIGGGLTRIGDTPVARFRIGVRGEHADTALAWIAERGGYLTHRDVGLRNVAA
jgi:D-methionine transport system ATP-binding protein